MSAEVLTVQPQVQTQYSYARNKIYSYGWFTGSLYPSSEYSTNIGGEQLSFNAFMELMNLYTMQTNSNSDSNTTVMATSGGFQQYLIRKQLEGSDVDALQPVKGFMSDTTTFHNLPDSLQLHIFSYLGSKDLCIISEVCTHWAVLACDGLLWKRRLMIYVQKWKTISHTTNPDLYQECKSDLHNKEIYLRCCPEVNRFTKNQNLAIHSFSSYIRSFLPKKIPKIAMFGPGMETNTKGIVRKIIEEKTDIFHVMGMFPGRVRGLGSGFTIKVDNSLTLNFTPLYSNTKHERESRSTEQRLLSSRFFQHRPKTDTEQDNETDDVITIFPITSEMKDFLRSLDGYIFIIEASLTEEAGIESARSELFSMINDQWCNPSAPITVLACTPSTDTPRVSNIDLVRRLSLSQFNRPWQIHSTVVEDIRAMVPALEWLIERCQRR